MPDAFSHSRLTSVGEAESTKRPGVRRALALYPGVITNRLRPLLTSITTNLFLWREFEDPGSGDYGPGLIRFDRIKESLSYFVAILF